MPTEFELVYQKILSDSLVLAAIALFFFFGLRLINKLEPGIKRTADLAEKFMDDIAKPLIPVAAGAVEFLAVQGKSMEAWARSNQQLVDVVQESGRTNREYYEMRMTQQADDFKRQLKERDAEIERIKKESAEQIARLTKENTDLKAELEHVKGQMAGKQDKPRKGEK